MEAIFEKMLKQAVSNLAQLEKRGLLKFKVVCGNDEYGTLVVAKEPVKPKKRTPLPGLAHGGMRDYVLQWVDKMAPGDVACIPYRDWPPETVRSNACAYANLRWGKSSYTSTINRKSKQVEIYRYPKDALDFAVDLLKDAEHDPI